MRRMIALAILSFLSPAQADEVWVCKMPEPWASSPALSRYWLHGSIFSRVGEPRRVYTVLANNNRGIVAAFGWALDPKDAKAASLPPIKYPVIASETFAIDRKTGKAIRGSLQMYGSAKTPESGMCHPQRGN